MSYAKRLAAWLLTDAGKKFSYFAAGTAATTVLMGHFVPHTLLLDKYKDFMHLYKNGFTVPLTPKLQQTFSKALDLTGIEQRDRHLFKPFACCGFDIFSAGSTFSKFGVIIGLPANFFYENVESIDKHAIKIRDDSIMWDLDEGQLLQNSLILSEEAQIYAIAREIKFRDTPKLIMDTVFAATSCLGLYGLSNAFNNKWDLYVKPLPVRLILYCLVGAFTFGSYALCKDMSQVYYETKIDDELKALDPIFVKGGKEFYSKTLDRNKALRKLLGREGERMYTVLGNENYMFRYKHIPLLQRKVFFENPA